MWRTRILVEIQLATCLPAALETARAGPSSNPGPALGYPRADPGFSQGQPWVIPGLGRNQARRTFQVGSSDLIVLCTFDLYK